MNQLRKTCEYAESIVSEQFGKRIELAGIERIMKIEEGAKK